MPQPDHSRHAGPAALDVERIHESLADARRRLAARDAEVVRDQVTVTEIAAPTGDESRRAAWVARRFVALGLADVRTDDAGNVIGRRPGAATRERGREQAPVVVCAHLDTVFPADTALAIRRDGARLVGPGIGDNGRGLTAMLALAAEIDGTRVRTRRPVDFVATTGEEGRGDLRGAKHFFATGEPAAAALIVDGPGDERIVHRALGSRRFRVTVRGPGGHSWAAFGVANAVHAIAGLAARLAALALPAEPRTTLSVGRIGGGISVNAIPDEAWLEVDLRSTAPAMIDRFEAELRLAARVALAEENARRARGTPPLTQEIVSIGDRPCGELPADEPLVAAAAAATRLVGRVPELSTASTDANVPISLGVPAVAIGAGGRGGDAHTTAEWFDNTDGTLGIGRALTILVAAAGLEQNE
ncbi:MAG TPA: M20/M25/M40 family metallo-hydrolase [Gemmatimonadaceae bacterium]|nr:M20/M25/M40 family metallo-hydrolase [Gemmatimonadaceae bacterium]